MNLKENIKEMLLQPKYFGLLISKLNRPHTTVKRWIETGYKDLRLPENQKIISEITGIPESDLFGN
ncbi:hypothetical protein HZQ28_00915 [Elizabethkingia anophelis]|uniref:hypothetical protein n=1 Tax=Elizabethkingia TaxID=308865 RepID=UPI0018C2C8E3|nr:hypothetical protein [Elizabethkingia meningoseptica]MCT3943838.1 hypothetical protein [Elizabethkingia anophelis]MBG0515155.1 hypothetical protein [Elizabethkingia meningoseptica]MCT3993050.1 hypothetical protein [Elizabethkingia anophelis]MCT3997107.1 hypothetical protein [Elizabethkingia anophelis]MCT4256568.1 hypothetical protein [Elizabethkingia anophelis]